MAALMGTLPIALGLGAGAESRRPLGLAVVGGLLVSQLLTLYITPVIYIYLEQFPEMAAWQSAGPVRHHRRARGVAALGSVVRRQMARSHLAGGTGCHQALRRGSGRIRA